MMKSALGVALVDIGGLTRPTSRSTSACTSLHTRRILLSSVWANHFSPTTSSVVAPDTAAVRGIDQLKCLFALSGMVDEEYTI